MRILIDARFYGTENTGLGRYSINLIKELQKIDNKNRYFILLREKYFKKLKLRSNWEKVLAEVPHYSIREQIEIPRIIKKYNPDLTHFLHFNVPINFKDKFVVTIHDMTMHNKKTSSSNLLLPIYLAKHQAYKKVFKHAVVKSQRVIVPSEYVRNEITSYFKIPKEKVTVIYEGLETIPVKNYSTKKDNNELYFLYVGNTFPHKNLESAIKAIVSINQKTNQRILFYIISSLNKFTIRLKKKLSKLDAQDLVKLTGFVPDEKLVKLYENSVGFIYPSLSEGFGLPGLEAMNAGTILLASDIPVFREVYGNHAIYFDPRNVNSIEKAIKKTLSLKKVEAAKMIKENKKFIKRYSWPKMAKETLDVYTSINEGGHRL